MSLLYRSSEGLTKCVPSVLAVCFSLTFAWWSTNSGATDWLK
uniref:Uncharacterized protein n=1 Tax=Anguilla anguilla TaxID=7936 RepID=A0A0E9V3S0_ANGAN